MECNHEAFSFSNCRRRQVKGNFFGGAISSNGGSLLLREVDRRLGLTAAVARALGDRRQRGKVRHKVETMVTSSLSWAAAAARRRFSSLVARNSIRSVRATAVVDMGASVETMYR